MAYETKPDTGSLFKNDKRESDSHPNAKGSALIDGVEYWVDAWTNKSNSGAKWQALKFKRKEPRNGSQGAPAPRQLPADDLDDDVPFATCGIELEHRVG